MLSQKLRVHHLLRKSCLELNESMTNQEEAIHCEQARPPFELGALVINRILPQIVSWHRESVSDQLPAARSGCLR